MDDFSFFLPYIFFCLQQAFNMIYWEIAIKIHLSQKSEGTLECDASAHAHFSLRTAETLDIHITLD